MIRLDESNHEYDGNGRIDSHAPNVAEAEVIRAWEMFRSSHITPVRLFRLAVGMTAQTDKEARHLDACYSCRTAYEGYKSADQRPAREAMSATDTVAEFSVGTSRGDALPAAIEIQPSTTLESSSDTGCTAVPDVCREHLRVRGPIIFPGDEVAIESWQFGRILDDSRATTQS